MFQCPYCNASIGDDSAPSGRCPVCGSQVLWSEEGAEDNAKPQQAAQPPKEMPTLVDSHPSLGSVLQTMVNRAAYLADADESSSVEVAEANVPPAASLPAADVSPTGLANREGATVNVFVKTATEPTPHIDQLWKSTISPAATPRMTLKGESASIDPHPGLVIRARQLRQTGEYGAEDADYELLERIGEGGVGIVYAARQASVDRTVAIKMLKPDSKLDADSRQKFLGEAVVTGDLDHPNIVPVYDLGADDRGALFYSMKRVRGTPWSEAIGKKSLPENLEILMKVADAIAFAHSRGIVHRDIKPENVMLGDFGEVLVMDWGIALSTSLTLRSGSISQSQSMGGTPAYMAPEMATGPIDKIGERSDIYLLGGVLFEIITGATPHTGRDVLDCLHAAARNEIRPTEKSGELLDIAYQALSTDPGARYVSARAFQDAIRTYQSHSESIALSTRAAEDLQNAERTSDYQDYARALFAAEEALALWPENVAAAAILERTQLAYAQNAFNKEDFDLGLSLLDEFNAAHQPLIRKLAHGQRERANRLRRVRQLRNMAVGLGVTILCVVSAGMLYIRGKNQRLNQQNIQLGEQTNLLIENESSLKKLNTSLKDKSEDLVKQKTKVERTAIDLARQRTVAQAAARQALEEERYAEQLSYLSRIGLAAAQSRENAFLNIRQSLASYEDPKLAHLRHWEWGRLRYLSNLALVDKPTDGRIETMAIAANDPAVIVTGAASGALQFWDTNTWSATTHRFAQPISAVALSADGQWLAVACANDGNTIRVWKAETLKTLGVDDPQPPAALTLTAHQDSVLQLAFDSAGKQLLSASRDQTARLWNLDTQKAVEFTGHAGPVWSAAISPDGARVFTASDDRTVGIWNAENGARIERFRGHSGPVYCVACIPGDSTGTYLVASAGADGRMLLWNTADVRGVDFKAVRAQIVGERQAADGEEKTYRVLGTHGGDVYDVRFGGNNRYLVSCGRDNTVRVWDRTAPDGQASEYRVMRGHGGWVRGCAMLDEQRVVSTGYDQSLKVWNPETYRESIALQGHDDEITAAVFSRDGSRVITASRDRKAIVWDSKTGGKIATLDEGHAYLTSSVQFFGPRDDRVLTSAGDGSTIVWSLATGSQLRRFQGTGSQSVATLLPDNRWVMTGSNDNSVQLWQVEDANDSPISLKGHAASITCVAATQPENNAFALLFSGDSSGRGMLWSRDEASDTWSVSARVAHYPGFSITAARFTHDGKWLVTAGADHRVRQWNAQTGEELVAGMLQHPDAVRLMELTPDDRHLVTVSSLPEESQLLQVWSLVDHKVVQSHQLEKSSLHCITVSPDSTTVAFSDSSSDNTVWKMDLANGKVERFWDRGRLQASVWGLGFAPDGKTIMTVAGNQARLWSVADGSRLQSFGPHGPLLTTDLSPSGQLAVTGGSDGIGKIWNIAKAQVVAKLVGGHTDGDGHVLPIVNAIFLAEDQVATLGGEGKVCLWRIKDDGAVSEKVLTNKVAWTTLAASADGQQLILGARDGQMHLINLLAGEPPHSWTDDQGHTLSIRAVALSADNRLAISGGEDNVAIIWDIATGKLLQRLKGHTAGITAVGFSPDGRRALTASDDGTAKLWDVGNGVEVLAFDQHQGEVTAASFSPHGNLVLTASSDRLAVLAPISPIPPAVGFADARLAYSQPGTSFPIDSAPVLSDADVTTFAGAVLRVAVDGDTDPGLTEELLFVDAFDARHRLIRSGDKLLVRKQHVDNPTEVGAIAYDAAKKELRITFTESASYGIVEEAFSRIGYLARWTNPPAAARRIRCDYTDADGVPSPVIEKPLNYELDNQSSDVVLALPDDS